MSCKIISDAKQAFQARVDKSLYHSWHINTPWEILRRHCAPGINAVELKYLDTYHPRTLIDVGCGNGERIYPHCRRKKIVYHGIEKYQQYIDAAPEEWRGLIRQFDIGSAPLSLRQLQLKKADMVIMFGGAIGGLHEPAARKQAFVNMKSLLHKNGTLIVDTCFFEGFGLPGPGRSFTFDDDFPPQYFPSKDEFEELAAYTGLVKDNENIRLNDGLPIIYLAFKRSED